MQVQAQVRHVLRIVTDLDLLTSSLASSQLQGKHRERQHHEWLIASKSGYFVGGVVSRVKTASTSAARSLICL